MHRFSDSKKRLFILLISALIFIFPFYGVTVRASGELLYIGGIPAGFTVRTNGATVIGLNEVITADGIFRPAESGDIRVGDVILTVNKTPVSNVQSIADAIKNCGGNPIEIVISRKKDKITKFISPRKDVNGKYRLGLFLRDDLNGIGTITYFRNDGSFAALGHPVLDENGDKLDVLGGNCYLCSVIGLVKGEKGKAGELKGIFIDSDKIGSVEKNGETGLYGNAVEKYPYKKLAKAETGVGAPGAASIITCIDGVTPKEYAINIVKTDFYDKDNKNFVIKISDRELLGSAGGILQGMSGSPIIQKGKIIGAITHVFINDPTRGFGIGISKMLENQHN